MRLAIGAVMAAMLFSAQAMAQETTPPAEPATPPAPAESTCGPLAEAPAMINGAGATRAQFLEWRDTYEAWGRDTLANLSCRRTEAEELQTRRASLVDQYNAANSRLAELNAQAQAQAEAFNNR